MSNQTLNLTADLYAYLLDTSLREPAAWRGLREQTAGMPEGMMQIAPEQGQFMHLLIKLMGARKALEIGTFTGYSALWIASALPADGQLVACDINEQWTAIAGEHWAEAGLASRVDLRIAPALETLSALLEENGQAGSFDFAFIDADKANYDNYYEACLKLLRPGGLIAIDNVLWGGDVVDQSKQDRDTNAIRALNAKLRDDPRITLSMLPLADGLSLAIRER